MNINEMEKMANTLSKEDFKKLYMDENLKDIDAIAEEIDVPTSGHNQSGKVSGKKCSTKDEVYELLLNGKK